MRLYDSLTQEKREFVPRDGDHVTMYFCGPTVYNYIHVGNARPYVISMVAKRYFESLGYRVTLVENITDIDDRIIQKAAAQGRTAREVAEEFADAYREDTDRLGLGRPDVEPLATEHIAEIVELIAGLIEKGHAYQSGPDVYFDVDTWAAYGKLSKQQVAEMRHGARIDPGEDKADPLDFALWKGAKPGEPAWDSPWGLGRPGWHIECSAMSLKYLGMGFDIHGGGRDLIFPHHENEIAQAEGAMGEETRSGGRVGVDSLGNEGREGTHGGALERSDRQGGEASSQPFVRFWMHNGMLNLRTEKMSKSVGNILTLRNILDQHRPEALIAAFLGSHYRSPLEFTSDLLEETEQQVDRLRNVFRELADRAVGLGRTPGVERAAQAVVDAPLASPSGVEAAPAEGAQTFITGAAFLEHLAVRRRAFADALADDLNTAAALAEVFGLAREVNAALAAGLLSPELAGEVRTEMVEMVRVLGLDAVAEGEETIPADVLGMAEERQKCRAARDFARADALRGAIADRGFEVRDVPGGHKIVPIR